MNSNDFWISNDGVILSQRENGKSAVTLTVAFEARDAKELAGLENRLDSLQFSERSRLARVGIELFTTGKIQIQRNRLIAEAEAFVIDKSFPTHRYFRELLRPGIPVGRLFYAPESAKLTSSQIWKAIRANRIKLPNTISIDRFGKVYFTPHKRVFTLPPDLSELDLYYLVSGDRPRSYLDKIQSGEDVENLAIKPGGGILTSCSMYLPYHYVVLRRSSDDFGLHSGAVLLDPVKTFGTNVMLEIYNASDQMVVNPVVSIDIFSAPPPLDSETEELRIKRQVMHSEVGQAYRSFTHLREKAKRVRPTADIALRGQSAFARNESLALRLPFDASKKQPFLNGNRGFETVAEALRQAPEHADTLVVNFFPNLSEHIDILARCQRLGLTRLLFRRASRNNPFFLPNSAHAQLEAYNELGLEVYWYNDKLDDVYIHTYKRERGFFIREELVRQFQSSTIFAFYGSGVALRPEDRDRIERLIDQLVHFFGSSIGILTGGGDGAMEAATTAAHDKRSLTGACFLELEAGMPNFNVDFFNSFQETSRHNRQKWFEVADFCIFNVGGVGTLEEVGIELCNLKLGIRPRAPLVFFSDCFWEQIRAQIDQMVKTNRTPAWVPEYLLFSSDPDEVLAFYRKTLQIL